MSKTQRNRLSLKLHTGISVMRETAGAEVRKRKAKPLPKAKPRREQYEGQLLKVYRNFSAELF